MAGTRPAMTAAESGAGAYARSERMFGKKYVSSPIAGKKAQT
jgi:hypothetical protein